MQLGMIGLGRMGRNMVRRLLRSGHQVVVFDTSAETVAQSESEGARGVHALEELVEALIEPRVIWVMVPAGDPTSETIRLLSTLCKPKDIVIDGGNTNWQMALDDAAALKQRGIHYLDAGTSGGVWGLANGYCLMVGGPEEAYRHCEPVFKSLAPEEAGLVHTGPEGSGHFVKMVHNGIEYALMQAYAEGFHIMKASEVFPGMDMHAIAEAWRYGSVVRSWLLDLIADGLAKEPELEGLRGYVEDTGEGRWTVSAAVAQAIPSPTITMALYERFRSRMEDTFADKMLRCATSSAVTR
ncbi:phosphogluconate dehydrogenase (NAD(+)-dependent, decarboxylating) [Candidatus Nephthysia bennettiae]|uniref:phosphogluconate dehydrogenase (NAD(+)-dependent, decarboxylating) n=1 Tax=Candidatus Nephthysia bennettiae TaxID=3127016 RepID=UPI003313092D